MSLTIKECTKKIAELRKKISEIKDSSFADSYRIAYSRLIYYYQTQKDRLAQKIGKK